MQFVDQRDQHDRATLLPIIIKYVNEGSTIYSDRRGAYFTVEEEGYNHDTVNHSKEFKSSSGCCTTTIQGFWGLVKLKILSSRLPFVLVMKMGIYITF